MIVRPTLDLIVGINASVRSPDEFFDDEDDLYRVERILETLADVSDPVSLAGLLMSRLARSQAFTEGNKRTAVAVAYFVLETNGYSPEEYLPPHDVDITHYLLLAARGENVEQAILDAMASNAESFQVSGKPRVVSPRHGFDFYKPT